MKKKSRGQKLKNNYYKTIIKKIIIKKIRNNQKTLYNNGIRQ